MELGPIFQTLFNSIVYIMQSFRFTIGGYTVSLFHFFAWFLVGALTIRLIDWLRR